MANRAKVLPSVLGWSLSYWLPLRRAVAEGGLVASAPFSASFLTSCFAVSALWAGPPAAHHVAAACCAYHGWTGWFGPSGLPALGRHSGRIGLATLGWLSPRTWLGWSGGLGDLVRMVGSAFLLRRPVEVAWAVVVAVLVLAPLEVHLGSRRLATIAACGHLVPTIAVAMSGLSQVQRLGGDGLDVGASAVIVASAAALAYRTRSLSVTVGLLAAELVDLLLDTPLAGAEHVMAMLTGALTAWALGAGPGVADQAAGAAQGPFEGAPGRLEVAGRVRARSGERKGGRVPRSVSSGPSHEGPVPP